MIKFNNFTALPLYENINYELKPNKINVLIGSNGIGKSTLIFYLMKIYGGYSGEVLFGDKNFDDINLNGEINVVFQNPYLQFIGYDIVDEITYYYEQQNTTCDVDEILKTLNFENQPLHQLSGGQAQLFNIKLAILKKPKVLIIDEALSNLDFEQKREVINLLKENKITVLLITNNLEDAKLGDVVAELKDKQITETQIRESNFKINENDNDIILSHKGYNFKKGFNIIQGKSGCGKSYMLNEIFSERKISTKLVKQYPFSQIYFDTFNDYIKLQKIDSDIFKQKLDLLGMPEDLLSQDAINLSTGQLTILFSISYIIKKPELILLDESIEVLDYDKQQIIFKMLSELNVIFVSHNLSLFDGLECNLVEVNNEK